MSESHNEESLEGREALLEAACELIGQAAQELRIASQQLEGRLYRQRPLIEAIKARLLASRRFRLRLLVSEPVQALRESEPLLELLRRLSSQVEIHTPSTREFAFEHECLIADEKQLVLRDRPDNLRARRISDDAVAIRAQARDFDAAWDRSRPASELRRLGI